MPKQQRPPGTRRLNINLSLRLCATLEGLAEAQGTTLTEVLRESIALKRWIEQERAQGSRIVAVAPNGETRELVIP